jgi:bifunctional DNA-binding transcriptional regulator/antitoxin component of YhaV-PrlF toxin-antitoxin module
MPQLQTANLQDEYVRPISRGQITIPAAYRKAYGIDANTWIRIEAKPTKIILFPEEGKRKDISKYLIKLKAIKGGWWSKKDEKARLQNRKREEEKIKKLWIEK